MAAAHGHSTPFQARANNLADFRAEVFPRTGLMRPSAGTALTASPPLVIIGWTRMVSSSLKPLPVGVDGHEGETLAALRALMPRSGAPPAWAPLPMNCDLLGQDAVVGAAYGEHLLVGRVAARYGTSWPCPRRPARQGAPGRWLAPQELNLARLAQAVPVLDLDVFLGGHGHEHDPAGETLQHAGGQQPGGRDTRSMPIWA